MHCEITTNGIQCTEQARLRKDGLDRCFEHGQSRSNLVRAGESQVRPFISDGEAAALLEKAFEKLSGGEPELDLANVVAMIDDDEPAAPKATRARDRVFDAVEQLIVNAQDDCLVTELRVSLQEYRERCPKSFGALERMPFAGDLLQVINSAAAQHGSLGILYGNENLS